MNLFPMEYPRMENESRLDSLKQNVERCALNMLIITHIGEAHRNCPELRDRAIKQIPCRNMTAKSTLAAKFSDPGSSFPFKLTWHKILI